MNYNSNFYNTAEAEKRNILYNIRKKSNGLGLFVFAYFMLMQISATVIYLLLALSGLGEEDLSSSSVPVLLLDIFVSVFASFIPCLFYFLLANSKISDTIKVKPVNPSIIFPIICMGLAGAMFANYATNILAENFSLFRLENTVNINNQFETPLQIVLYIVSTAVVPALAEELAFRGVLMGSLRKYGDAFAIIASSVIFGAMHGNISQVPFAFILGLIFAYADCVTNSILPSIIIHFINNLYAVVVEILQNSGIDGSIFYGIYLLLILLFCATGILSFIIVNHKNSEFFRISNNSGVTAFNSNNIDISLKKKCIAFFTAAGNILCMTIFIFETIANLGVLNV